MVDIFVGGKVLNLDENIEYIDKKYWYRPIFLKENNKSKNFIKKVYLD